MGPENKSTMCYCMTAWTCWSFFKGVQAIRYRIVRIYKDRYLTMTFRYCPSDRLGSDPLWWGNPLNHSIMVQASWGGIMIPFGILNSKTLQNFRAGPGERGQTPELACGRAFTNGTRTPTIQTKHQPLTPSTSRDHPKGFWATARHWSKLSWIYLNSHESW